MKSPTIRAVVFGSRVTALISGAAGVFTFAHSSMMLKATAVETVLAVVAQSTPITVQTIVNRPPMTFSPIKLLFLFCTV
jgi:hypothetical protein